MELILPSFDGGTMFQFRFYYVLAAVSALIPGRAFGCTVFLVGKDATTDGSVLVSHSNDGEFDTDPRLVKVPAQDHHSPMDDGGVGSWPARPVYWSPEDYPRYVGTERGIPEYYPGNQSSSESPFEPIGYIRQVPHTFAYLEETYGAVNEYNVGIGESTCSAVFGAIPRGHPNGTAMFSIDELTHVALERSKTARQAIMIMGHLAVQYGFYGAGEFEGTAESLGVTDPNEAWIFHILPNPTGKSAIWAAQRIPDDSFAVLANMFVIRQVDPEDTDHFLMSPSVHQVALDYGWWKPEDGLLDFTKIYSDGEYAHKYYSGRRMWGAYYLVGRDDLPADYEDDLQSNPVYPVYTKPKNLLSVQDLFRFHRYSYQGTPYDMTAVGNLAGGPFSSPDRWKAGEGETQVQGNWERPIGLYRTSDTYVVQSKSDGSNKLPGMEHVGSLGAVLWFAPASPLGSVFTPFVPAMSDIPASFRSAHQRVFGRGESAFWAACVTHNVANLKWSYAIQDVTKRQDALEQASLNIVSQLEEQVYGMKISRSVETVGDSDLPDHDQHELTIQNLIDDTLMDNAAKIVSSLWSLSDELLFKYASGFVNELPNDNDSDGGGMSQMVGYPAWWLEAVGYPNGPPPPPTTPKCCHPTPQNGTMSSSLNTMMTGKAAMRSYLRSQAYLSYHL